MRRYTSRHQGQRTDFVAEFQALPALVCGEAEPRQESRPLKTVPVETEPWTVGPATIDLGDLYG